MWSTDISVCSPGHNLLIKYDGAALAFSQTCDSTDAKSSNQLDQKEMFPWGSLWIPGLSLSCSICFSSSNRTCSKPRAMAWHRTNSYDENVSEIQTLSFSLFFPTSLFLRMDWWDWGFKTILRTGPDFPGLAKLVPPTVIGPHSFWPLRVCVDPPEIYFKIDTRRIFNSEYYTVEVFECSTCSTHSLALTSSGLGWKKNTITAVSLHFPQESSSCCLRFRALISSFLWRLPASSAGFKWPPEVVVTQLVTVGTPFSTHSRMRSQPFLLSFLLFPESPW